MEIFSSLGRFYGMRTFKLVGFFKPNKKTFWLQKKNFQIIWIHRRGPSQDFFISGSAAVTVDIFTNSFLSGIPTLHMRVYYDMCGYAARHFCLIKFGIYVFRRYRV
jgi:hypothetical protein